MYLKSLELSGFKSFAEPTDILLEPGITGIVGPNGCGKSNTVDAIRWCLGELSPRTLRSKSITDVIFNGTRRLSPAACAQVTMTFDNSDHSLDVAANEVAVTRKVYRDGTSEYLINKTSCRLKDIKTIFLGTGLGDDGYSIMEGSMVDFLLTAKPHERRLLFDEASGAARFASKRDEAVSKMEKIDTDLNRVKDQIEIIGAERKRLESQAKKARLYERVNNEKTELEIKKVSQILENCRLRAQTIREESFDPKRAELERQSAGRDKLNADAQTLEAERMALEQQLSLASNEFHETLRERDLAVEKIKNLEEKIRERRALLESREKESRTLDGEILRCREDLNLAKAVHQEKTAQRDREIEEFDQAHPHALQTADGAGRRHQIQTQIEDLKHQILDLNEQITKDRNENRAVTTEMSQDQASLKYILREHKKQELEKFHLEELLHELKTKIESLKLQIDAAGRDAQNLTQERAGIAARRQPLETLATLDLPAQKASLQARLEQWEKLAQEDAVIRGSRAIEEMSLDIKEIAGPIGKLIKCPAQNYPALKEILGERLYWFLAENAETALRAIETLEEKKQGRATFVLMDRLTQSLRPASITWETTSKTAGRTVDLDYLLGSTDVRTKKAILSLVGPVFVQGTSIFGESVLRGGQGPQTQSEENTALTHLQERQRIQGLLRDNEERAGRTQAELSALREQGRQAEERQNNLSLNLQGLRAETSRFNQELENNGQNLKYAAETLMSLEKDAQQNLCSVASKKERLGDLEKSVNANIDSLAGLQARLEQSSHGLAEAAIEMSKVKEFELSRQLIIERATQEISLLEQKCVQLETTLSANTQKLAYLQTEQKNLQSDLKKSGESSAALTLEIAAIEAAHAERVKNLEDLQSAGAGITQKIQALEARVAGAQEAIGALEEELRGAEIELRSLDFETSRAREDACRIFNAAPEQIDAKLKEASERSPITRVREGESLEETLNRLNLQIQRLGQINFLAQPEYDRLGERMTFLQTQRDDILKAKTDIQTAIARINTQIEGSFETTFNAVRVKFKEIFATLFEGGEADLALTESDSFQQRGVEIFVQPPGKKLQSLAQLSQGEKALTAVSLLFAFFSTHPAPVCILDEIDAPLDEANVLRFRKMLEKFAKHCQFVIITHNKKTMEAAKELYGVTMEELGVSKIISVKLEEVAAAVG